MRCKATCGRCVDDASLGQKGLQLQHLLPNLAGLAAGIRYQVLGFVTLQKSWPNVSLHVKHNAKILAIHMHEMPPLLLDTKASRSKPAALYGHEEQQLQQCTFTGSRNTDPLEFSDFQQCMPYSVSSRQGIGNQGQSRHAHSGLERTSSKTMSPS